MQLDSLFKTDNFFRPEDFCRKIYSDAKDKKTNFEYVHLGKLG